MHGHLQAHVSTPVPDRPTARLPDRPRARARRATGDALAQQLEDAPFDARRNLLTCAYGAAFIGPVGHAWYMALDRAARALLTPGSFAFVGGKVRPW
jgi:hypothetical protein